MRDVVAACTSSGGIMGAEAIELYVAERGTGSPVVLLHSGGMSSAQWRLLIDRLSGSHRVLALDFLGSGKNPPWPDGAPFDFSMDVEAVARLLSLPGNAPAHVVGHSYGGLIALTLARKHPSLVRSVAVYDPVAFGVLHDPDDAEGLADLSRASSDPVFSDSSLGGSERWLEGFIDYWNGPGTWRSMPEASRDRFLRVGRKVYLEVTSLMSDRARSSDYATLAVPVLLMVGEHSPPAARRVSALLATVLPHPRAQIIPSAGHMGPLTHSPLVNDFIATFLALVERGGGAGL
jgi:pimeloyl-ACP methyl ester carboxylesterase